VNRRERITKALLVEPGTDANIADRDSAWTGGPDFEDLSAKQLSRTAKELLANGVKELSKAQELLWASDTYALLVVFQALDAAGKDSTIEHVMSGVNPQGVQVVSFKQPSSEELDHDFLWRTSKALPERGRVGVCNRSHYEEVVALRVHPESTPWAPWYVIPADHKPVMQAAEAGASSRQSRKTRRADLIQNG
jgi:polyphosphate kinase 2 (PPK2 family)